MKKTTYYDVTGVKANGMPFSDTWDTITEAEAAYWRRKEAGTDRKLDPFISVWEADEDRNTADLYDWPME